MKQILPSPGKVAPFLTPPHNGAFRSRQINAARYWATNERRLSPRYEQGGRAAGRQIDGDVNQACRPYAPQWDPIIVIIAVFAG